MASGPLWQDLSFGIRLLRRSPSFTIAAALSLALGIAATSAGFGIFNGLFLSSLPYPAARVFVGVAALLAGAALAAHWLLAASVDPWKALRSS